MADVTVLGAGGATVTLTLTSDQNAAIAQNALGSVTKLVQDGTLAQVDYAGSPLGIPPGLVGGVVVQATSGDVGGISALYASAVVAAADKSTIIGGQNFTSTVAATDGSSLTYWNQSAANQSFFGAGSHFLINSGGAIAFFDKGASVIQTEVGGNTAAVVQDEGLVLVQGGGNTTVSAADAADIVVAVQGDSTVPVTVTGGGAGGSIQYLAIGGKGIINPGSANTTVFGNVGSGTATVFGGTGPGGATAPEFTGKLTVVEGQGYFQGGTGGGNQLFSSTVAGSATLVGGGDGDLLFSMGAGQFLIAGAGSETLTGFNVDASVGGSIFQSGGGNATIFGNSGGGNAIAFGGGLTLADGRNEAALGGAVGNANIYYSVAVGGGHGISDFISGLDTFDMTLTTTVTGQTLTSLDFFTAGQSGSPFGAEQGTRMTLSGGTIVDFFGTEVKLTDLT